MSTTSLATTSQTIAGAINELKTEIEGLAQAGTIFTASQYSYIFRQDHAPTISEAPAFTLTNSMKTIYSGWMWVDTSTAKSGQISFCTATTTDAEDSQTTPPWELLNSWR